MPIRAENKKRYPKDWKKISHHRRFVVAKGRCECKGECGIDHEEENDSFGRCIMADFGGTGDERCHAEHGKPHDVTGSIVCLTVAHLDHQPENNHPSNLKAMCQRCHNRYDMAMRRAGTKRRRLTLLREQQPDMFDE